MRKKRPDPKRWHKLISPRLRAQLFDSAMSCIFETIFFCSIRLMVTSTHDEFQFPAKNATSRSMSSTASPQPGLWRKKTCSLPLDSNHSTVPPRPLATRAS